MRFNYFSEFFTGAIVTILLHMLWGWFVWIIFGLISLGFNILSAIDKNTKVLEDEILERSRSYGGVNHENP